MTFGIFGGRKGKAGFGVKAPAGKAVARPTSAKAPVRPRTPPPSPHQQQQASARPAPRHAEEIEVDEDEDGVVAPVSRQVALSPRNRVVGPLNGAGAVHNLPVTVFHEPDEAALAKILSFQGKVVSAELPLTQKQRQMFAALDDGTFLIAKSEVSSSAVSSARQLVLKGGCRMLRTYHVDLETIRRVYDSGGRRSGTIAPTRDHDTASMQRTVVELIRTAASMRCSDIHIIVEHYEAKIRVRSDGVMMQLRELPAATAQDLCQAAFNMADASDATYKPFEYQGARITAVKSSLPEGVQAVRLQFNPLPDGGRYAVMRLLYNQKVAANTDVDELGYDRRHIAQIKRMREKPFGINIISGPTGSGKSTTLQRSLTATLRDKRFEVNLITVEDPPEYEITGAAQLPVLNVKTEEERREAFRAAITASLRSDPDIVMIGEIRDGASATLAFQAAMTGHQVWASLHANDAVSVLDRLRDVGVDTYKLTDPSLMTGMIGQRLVRRLCDECKLTWAEGLAEGMVDREQEDVVCEAVGGDEDVVRGHVRFARPGGCPACSKRGFSGRTVAAETILPSKKFMERILSNDKSGAVDLWLAELDGMTMLEHAMVKMAMGECDVRDVKDRVGVVGENDPVRMKAFLREALKSET